MKAVVCHNAELSIENITELVPLKGQVLLDVIRCGVCGSDLHMQHNCDHMHNLATQVGFQGIAKNTDKFVMGHEFCGKIVDYGPKTRRKFKIDSLVCAMPLLHIDHLGYQSTGLSPNASGGYAEQVLVQSSLMFEVPNGLDADNATMTEPMAVALHAVRRSRIKTNEPAIVIGCGPVGLGIILMLKAAGVKKIIASDFSENRRRLAQQCGADILINPANNSPFENWKELGLLGNAAEALNYGLGIFNKIQATGIPWWHAWRVADKLGALPKRPVIFECVGVPGILQHIIDGAPLFSKIVVVGVCMQSDRIEPALAINKEIEMQFVLGYTPLEFRDSLHMIAEGKIDCSPLITGIVGLEGVTHAFSALRDPERHAKILVDPKKTGYEISVV